MRWSFLAALAPALMAWGCASASIHVRPDAGPLDLEKERVIILPCEVGNFEPQGFENENLNKAATAGIRDALKGAGRPLEQARAFFKAAELDGMARRITSAALLNLETCEGREEAFDLRDQAAPPSVRALPAELDRLIQLAVRKFHFTFRPRFVFGLVLDGLGPVPSKITLQYRLSAVLYDLDAGKVHACTSFKGDDMGLEAGDAMVRAEELGRDSVKALAQASGQAFQPAADEPGAEEPDESEENTQEEPEGGNEEAPEGGGD